MTILSQVTFKYEKKKTKKKTKGRKKRQSSKDLRLLGWRLNPFLPGALSPRLQERTVIAKTMFNDTINNASSRWRLTNAGGR